MCFGTEYPKRRGWPSCKQTQDARREELSGGQGPQHSSSELQGGTRGHRCPGRRGQGGRVPTTRRLIALLLLLPLPLSMPMHVGPGDAVSLVFLVSLGSDAVGGPGCGVVQETLTMEVRQGDDDGRFPHTSALLRSRAALVMVVVDGWTLESRRVDLEVTLLLLKSSLHNWPMLLLSSSSRPPPLPPEEECVTACHSLDLFAAWLGWHVIGRRERWVEELALHPTLHLLNRPPTPSKQAHGRVACTSKRIGLARPIKYLGQQCCCGRGQSTSSTLECLPSLHHDGPFEP